MVDPKGLNDDNAGSPEQEDQDAERGGRSEVDLEPLVKKAGGQFRFVTLIQRRMRELQRGAPALVDRRESFIRTALAEHKQGKIWLTEGEEEEEEKKKPPKKQAPKS